MDLNEHLANARAKRWASKTPEERKAFGAMMNAAKKQKSADVGKS